MGSGDFISALLAGGLGYFLIKRESKLAKVFGFILGLYAVFFLLRAIVQF